MLLIYKVMSKDCWNRCPGWIGLRHGFKSHVCFLCDFLNSILASKLHQFESIAWHITFNHRFFSLQRNDRKCNVDNSQRVSRHFFLRHTHFCVFEKQITMFAIDALRLLLKSCVRFPLQSLHFRHSHSN